MKNRRTGTILELKKIYKIPKEAVFLGFCIHHEKRDEFLCFYDDNNDSCTKAWSATPRSALYYPDQLEMEKIIKNINNGCTPAAVFDVGYNYNVVVL